MPSGLGQELNQGWMDSIMEWWRWRRGLKLSTIIFMMICLMTEVAWGSASRWHDVVHLNIYYPHT